jgi:hypothetical protein
MSVVIGYWSDAGGGERQNQLQQLLTRAVTAAGYKEPKIISSCAAEFPPRPRGGGPRRPPLFGAAACGRHASLAAVVSDEPRGETTLKATLSAAGPGAPADVWARVSGEGLVLGRGAFGRATLFWARIADAVWFSSRLATLLQVLGTAEVSVAGFYAYGCFSYIPAPLAPVRGLHAIPAGSEAIWSGVAPAAPPQILSRHEWRETEAQISDEGAAAVELRRLLEESLAAQLGRLRGEPVGLFLSGGLDSAVTAALLARAGVSVRAYTLDFGAGCFSEVQYAELVARRLGMPLTRIPVTARRVRATSSAY